MVFSGRWGTYTPRSLEALSGFLVESSHPLEMRKSSTSTVREHRDVEEKERGDGGGGGRNSCILVCSWPPALSVSCCGVECNLGNDGCRGP